MKRKTDSNPRLRVGLAQMDSAIEKVEENVARLVSLIETHQGKVDLLVFPELCLTGYNVGRHFHECSLRLDDTLLQEVVARTEGITVAFGFVEETASFKFYNSLAFASDRQLRYVHRKIFLPNYGIFEEKKFFSAGRRFQCLDIDGFRAGPLVCGDAWNPALVHLAAADEANLLIIAANSPSKGLECGLSSEESWQRLNRFYASMYGAYVVFVNRVGNERGYHFWGQSEIVDPAGHTVVAGKADVEEVAVGEIDLARVRQMRTVLNTARDDDLYFIHRQLNEIILQKDYLCTAPGRLAF